MSDVRATTALTETLADIAKYYGASAQPPREAVSQTRTAHASKPPLPADVLSVRRETVDLLASWAEVVIDGRDLHPDIHAGDVPALTSFLGVHAGYLVDLTTAVLYELGTIATALEQIVKQSRPRRAKVGPCPERDDEGNPCMGLLTATVRKSDSLLPSQIRCSADPRSHVYEPHEWTALARRMGAIVSVSTE